MEEKSRLILVTNDDGISAKGIRSLVEVARKYGEVIVIAPDKPQSGMGHAITMNNPLRLNKSSIFGDIEAYNCLAYGLENIGLCQFSIFIF